MVTFNIIYTRQTAIPLTVFAPSLLENAPIQLRLVANGCDDAEKHHLQTLVATDNRLSYFELPEQSGPSHGAVLNYLHEVESADRFAIVDSDLFAIGPFLPEVISADLLTILPPTAFWSEADEAFQIKRHRMGCTYFAIYDSKTVARVRQTYKIGFQKYQWQQLTPAVQALLEAVDYRKRYYDTGKVLNGLIQATGGKIIFGDGAALRHLGGVSRGQAVQTKHRRPRWRRYLRHRVLPPPRSLKAREARRSRKLQSSHYFGQLLAAVQAGSALPPVPEFEDRFVKEKMQAFSAEIVKRYQK